MVFGALFVEFIRISWGPCAPRPVQRRAPREHARARDPALVVYGVVLLLVLFVAPAGVAGLVRRLADGRSALAAWAKPRGPTPSDPATGAEAP